MENGTVTIICAVIGSAAMTEAVKALIALLKRRLGKRTGVEEHLAAIDEKVDKLDEKSDAQYLSLLRLTVMSNEMPISERMIAGKEYVRRGGNGDVKKFIHELDREYQETHSP